MHAISQCDSALTEHVKAVVCEDGYRLRYRVWPAAGVSAGNFVLVNGMMSHSAWFRQLAHHLTELQLNVVGADRRGSGMNPRDRGDAPSRQMLLSDFRRIIESESLSEPIYLAGWCWGALPAVNLALELGQKLSGLVLLAPGLFPSPKIKRAAQQELAAGQDVGIQSAVLRSPLTAEMFSDRTDVWEFILNDRLAQHLFTPRFFRISCELWLIATLRLTQLTQPVLLLLAANDETADNERTLRAFQQLPKTAVSTATLDCHHGMQFETPEGIAGLVSEWLQYQSGVAILQA
jgi:pimeloyl-ACP methyl ester carboxylesterase